MDTVKNIYKNASGQHLLKQLFFETAETSRERVLYTLKGEDHEGYPSLRRIYLEMADETEFYFAEKYFDGYPHWKKLLACTWFVAALEPIRDELRSRNLADQLLFLKQASKNGNVSATKYLLEEAWKPKSKVGRPSKEKIKQEADRLFMSSQDINEDLERLQEHLANG
jgi:hypothetical protein